MRPLAIVLLLASSADAAIVMFGEVRTSTTPLVDVGKQAKFVFPDFDYVTDVPEYEPVLMLAELGTWQQPEQMMRIGLGFGSFSASEADRISLNFPLVGPHWWDFYPGRESEGITYASGRILEVHENVPPTMPEPSSMAVWTLFACLVASRKNHAVHLR